MAVRAMFRRYERDLACSRCRSVVGFALLRPFALVRIRHVDGHEVRASSGEIFHLTCTCGARYQRALQALVIDIRDAESGRVTLR